MYGYIIFFVCGPPHISVFTHLLFKYLHPSALSAFLTPLPTPPLCGRHKWMTPKKFTRCPLKYSIKYLYYYSIIYFITCQLFYKDRARILVKLISELCHISMALRSFPDACKIAKITPLFKKGSKTDPSYFKPISPLPLLSKVFERIVLNQTNDFLSLNKILYDYLSDSTDTCLLFLIDTNLNGFDDRLLTGVILIDLLKTFDTINHGTLSRKLSIIGFSDDTVK